MPVCLTLVTAFDAVLVGKLRTSQLELTLGHSVSCVRITGVAETHSQAMETVV